MEAIINLFSRHFKKAQETWKLFLDMTQSAHGVHQLVQHALIRHGRRRQLRQEQQQQLLEREQQNRGEQRQLNGGQTQEQDDHAEPTPEQLEKEDRARVRIEIGERKFAYSFQHHNHQSSISLHFPEAIWREVQPILQASDFLAHLVVAMLETGYPEDAEFFAKKVWCHFSHFSWKVFFTQISHHFQFTIYGNSFLTPMHTAAEKVGFCWNI
jgi:hypothetical protein